MTGNLRVQHPPDGNAQTVPPRPSLIPRQLIVQGELPPLQVRLSRTAPYPIQTAGEGNWSLDLLIFGYENDVGHPQLQKASSPSRSMEVSKPASFSTAG